MKRRLSIVAVSAVSLSVLGACSQQLPQRSQSPIGIGDSREHVMLTNWKFMKADLEDAKDVGLDDSKWQRVRVPHTWNNLDGQDGGNNYLRTACWYRRTLNVPAAWLRGAGKRVVIRFRGANRQTDVYVNGAKVGSHLGGFGAFAFDITSALHAGSNTLAVRVDNRNNNASPPLNADFTFFGGLYRPVEIEVMNPVHISATDYASPGVALATPKVSDAEATVTIRTLVENDSGQAEPVEVMATVLDAAGDSVAHVSAPVALHAGVRHTVNESIALEHPHLWNGREDPYLYRVRVDVLHGGHVVDSVTQPLGVRTFHIDKKKGFFLNGHPYHLHGVDRHQDRPDKGWAISHADHDQDMALIKEMGCTAIRLAHYQHSEYFYELCDREGMIVWAEVPVVNEVKATRAFTDNAEQQLRELIRQNINHPSICFWSIGNEVRKGDPVPLYTAMNKIAHEEDPSRITTVAFAQPARDVVSEEWNPKWYTLTDTFGQNEYYGWYRGSYSEFRPFLDTQGSVAISEYGAGASIYFHSEHPVVMDHTEEYQCLFHEAYWPAIKESPHIWGSFVWNMFDFAADQRREGDHAGRNDKGLVTYDRKTKKDAFYYYKANWSQEPTIHINSKRFTVRGLQKIAVKVYSNSPEVELVVNGKSLGKKSGRYATFVWDDVPLVQGENRVIARGEKDGKAIQDECTWTYKPGAPQAVFVPQDDVMREVLAKNGPPGRK